MIVLYFHGSDKGNLVRWQMGVCHWWLLKVQLPLCTFNYWPGISMQSLSFDVPLKSSIQSRLICRQGRAHTQLSGHSQIYFCGQNTCCRLVPKVLNRKVHHFQKRSTMAATMFSHYRFSVKDKAVYSICTSRNGALHSPCSVPFC